MEFQGIFWFNGIKFYVIEKSDIYIRVATDKPMTRQQITDFIEQYQARYRNIYFNVRPFVDRGKERAAYLAGTLFEYIAK